MAFVSKKIAAKEICCYFCTIKHMIMLGIDSKREIITGEFAIKIWSEVLAIWRKEKVAEIEEATPKYEVEWV